MNKKINRLAMTTAIAAILSMGSIAPAHALSCYATNVTAEATTPIMAAIQAMQQAIVTAINNASNIATDKDNVKTSEDHAQRVIDDGREVANNQQQHNIRNTERIQDALYNSSKAHAPTTTECAAVTASLLSEYYDVANQKKFTDTVILDAKTQRDGPAGGSASVRRTAMVTKMNALKKGGQDAAAYSDPILARTECTSAKCFNDALENNLKLTLALSTGDRPPPISGNGNPQLLSYYAERTAWENNRAAALATVERVMANMITNPDYYQQALGLYKTAFGDTNAAKYLTAKFPNANNIGLSKYELMEAQFIALAASGGMRENAVQGENQLGRVGETRKALHESINIARAEQEAYKTAMQVLRISPPAVSASALSVTN